MLISRRGFLKLIGAALAAGQTIPALAKNRAPYVFDGESVSYIGHCPGGFIGSMLVHKIEAWDGIGYPAQLWNNAYGKHRKLERYYDFDLANFVRDVPHGFWSMPGSAKYPNVHTWLREQRFGETVAEAIRHLNFYSSRSPA